MRLAFENAWGTCVFSSELDRFAQLTYAKNFGETPHGDIRAIQAESIPDHDVLVAGFPCQPFSIAGVSKHNALGTLHGFDHPTQGTLFFEIVRILKAKRPKGFLLENVKNLRSHDGGRTYSVILDTLRNELGYDIHDKVIDAAAMLPQHRERTYIVGFRSPVEFRFPDVSLNGSRPQLRSLLEPEPDPKYTISAHLWGYLQDYAAKHRARGNGFGFGLVDPNDPGVTTRTLSARYYKDGSEILLDTGLDQPRRLTPRECARIMGFPERFCIPVSDTQAYKQFGNSVAVPVVEQIAIAIAERLV
jgi:DNA (cytosine-5)-methyltransferase 1